MEDSILVATIANKEVICDSIKMLSDSLRVIVSENVTLEALEKSEAFYSSAFDKMQESFSIFVNKVDSIILLISIFVGVLGVFFTIILPIYAQKENKNLRKELDEKYDKRKEDFESWFAEYRPKIEKAKDIQELTFENHYLLSEQGVRLNKFDERFEKFESMKNDIELLKKQLKEYEEMHVKFEKKFCEGNDNKIP